LRIKRVHYIGCGYCNSTDLQAPSAADRATWTRTPSSSPAAVRTETVVAVLCVVAKQQAGAAARCLATTLNTPCHVAPVTDAGAGRQKRNQSIN